MQQHPQVHMSYEGDISYLHCQADRDFYIIYWLREKLTFENLKK